MGLGFGIQLKPIPKNPNFLGYTQKTQKNLCLGKNPNFLVETLKKNLQKIWVFRGWVLGIDQINVGFLDRVLGVYPNPYFIGCECMYKVEFLGLS